MKKKLFKLIGILFLAGAAICLYFTYRQWKLYQDGNKEYQKLAMYNTVHEELSQDAYGFGIDWDTLSKENPDIVGWIRMSPSVDYPIVQGEDNRFYLHNGFHKEYNINGCIFMHCDNADDWTDPNTILYGHNMNNGSMFGNNDYYLDKEYALKNPCFNIFVPDGMYAYRIFNTLIVYDASNPYEIHFTKKYSFSDYLEEMVQIRHYGMDVDVSSKDKIITLSTCTSGGTQRFLIQGVLESFTDNEHHVYSAKELYQARDHQ